MLNSERTENPWTLAISKKSSNLDSVVLSFPSFNVHGRRRFLELVVVENVEGAADLVKHVPNMASFNGIDRVQTVGVSLAGKGREEALWAFASTGVYRLVRIEDMFMRSASEPYDGTTLASLFTYAVYERRRPIPLEGAI